MLPSGSPHGSCSAAFLIQPRPARLGMSPAHSRLDPPTSLTMRKCPTDLLTGWSGGGTSLLEGPSFLPTVSS